MIPGGLQEGDLIVSVNAEAVASRRDLYLHLWRHEPGEALMLEDAERVALSVRERPLRDLRSCRVSRPVDMRLLIDGEPCGGFDTTLRSTEDRDMWIRIAAKRRVWHQGKVLVEIRKPLGRIRFPVPQRRRRRLLKLALLRAE